MAGMTLMWEVRASDGRLAELLAWLEANADPAAELFRSDGADARVVLLDPSGRGVPDVPPALVARPPHQWHFEPVQRHR